MGALYGLRRGMQGVEAKSHSRDPAWAGAGHNLPNPKGPCTQCLGTWDIGNSNYGIGFG